MLLYDTCALTLHNVCEPVFRFTRDRCDECSVVHNVPAVACILLRMPASRRDPQTVAEVTLRSRRDLYRQFNTPATRM